jgi:hypothetical protein
MIERKKLWLYGLIVLISRFSSTVVIDHGRRLQYMYIVSPSAITFKLYFSGYNRAQGGDHNQTDKAEASGYQNQTKDFGSSFANDQRERI